MDVSEKVHYRENGRDISTENPGATKLDQPIGPIRSPIGIVYLQWDFSVLNRACRFHCLGPVLSNSLGGPKINSIFSAVLCTSRPGHSLKHRPQSCLPPCVLHPSVPLFPHFGKNEPNYGYYFFDLAHTNTCLNFC